MHSPILADRRRGPVSRNASRCRTLGADGWRSMTIVDKINLFNRALEKVSRREPGVDATAAASTIRSFMMAGFTDPEYIAVATIERLKPKDSRSNRPQER